MPRISQPLVSIVVWCGDGSGSMRSMGKSPQLGAKEFINKHIELDTPSSRIYLHFTTFNSRYTVVFSDFISNITPEIINKCIEAMIPGGQTLLYDSVAQCCNDLSNINKTITNTLPREVRLLQPNFPISFTLMTDGHDTCSQINNIYTMRQKIKDNRKLGHTFFFLGANQNAIEKGSLYGFNPSTSLQVGSDPRFSLGAFRSVTSASSRCVSGAAPEFVPMERNVSCSSQEATLYSQTPPTSPTESKYNVPPIPPSLFLNTRNDSYYTPPKLNRNNNKPPTLIRNVVKKNNKIIIRNGPADTYGRTEYWICTLCNTDNPGDLKTWGNTKCSLCESFP